MSRPLPSSPAPLSRLLQNNSSCSIPSSRLNPPLSRRPRTASGLDRSTACRFISIGLDTHSQFPNQEPPQPPLSPPVYLKYVSALQCRHGRPSILFFPLRNHSFSDRKCPTTTAHTRRDQGCPPFPPSRGMCRHGPAAGWVPIPVSTLAHQPPPGRFPYLPFPVSRIKTHVDPVAVPSSAPSPLLLIPSFSLLRLLSNGTFLHKLTSPHSFLFHPVALVISDRQTLCHSFLLSELRVIYIYIHKHIYIQKPFKLPGGPRVASLLHWPSPKYEISLLHPTRSSPPAIIAKICRPTVRNKSQRGTRPTCVSKQQLSRPQCFPHLWPLSKPPH